MEDTTRTSYGRWWLPRHSDDKVPGVLEQDPQGHFILSLVGVFKTDFAEAATVPLIHGVTNDESVTLLNSFELLQRPSSLLEGPHLQKILANRLLFGIHLDAPDTACFTQVTVEIENAMHFLYPFTDGVVHGRSRRTKTAPFGSSQATINELARSTFDFEGFTFTAFAAHRGFNTTRARGGYKTQATTTPKFSIRRADPFTLAQADTYAKALMDLLTLASSQPCGEISMDLKWTSDWLTEQWTADRERQMTLHTSMQEPVADSEPNRAIEADARVAGSMIFKVRPGENQQDFYRYMFTCRDVPFDQLGPAWLGMWNRLRPTMDILFSQEYVSTGYLEQKAMEIAAVAESLQRELYKDHLTLMPKAAFKALRLSVQRKLTSAEWGLVNEMMDNNPRFKARMLALLDKPAKDIVDQVVPDREAWAVQVAERRNSMAHGRAAVVIAEEKNLRMMYLIEQTRLVVRLVLACNLGIKPAVQREYIEHRQELRVLRLQVERADTPASQTDSESADN